MSDYGSIDLSGTLVTASGVAACRPRALTVYGSSTQDGTPTPSAPVSIVSVGTANLLPNTASTQTINGVTFTVNADGSVTVTGTATARTDFVLASGITFDGGTYTVSGAPSATGTGDWNVRLDMTESPYTNYLYDNGYTSGNRQTGTIPAGVPMNAAIRVYAGKSPNVTFKPMFNAGSTAYPYVPYGNAGLWAKRTSDESDYTVTPIDLDGHELRSLPDGTRDELTVDEYGHAVLVQRVGSVTLDGSSVAATERRVPTSPATATRMIVPLPSDAAAITAALRSQFRSDAFVYSADAYGTANKQVAGIAALYQYSGVPSLLACIEGTLTVAQVNEWLAANEPTLLYPLATLVAHDLGTIDPVPLCGPDMTAQTVPSAEFELTALLKTGRSTVMWDGEELSAGWTFVSDRREQLLTTDVATIDVPGRDGALFGGVTRAVRQVTLALHVMGPFGERAPHVRELAARLAVDGPRQLMFSDEAPLYRMAVPNAESDSEVYYDAEGYTDVEFVCTDPWLYGEERSVTVPSGGSVTFTVGGTAPTWPTITASATGGSGGAWILHLDDSSKGIYAAIASGMTRPVVADCDARTLTVNDTTSMLAPSYDWPELTPGTHTLAMTAGTGTATVTWTERWW